MIPMDASDVGVGKLGFTLRVPIGVVGAISPFNFPLNLVAHKVAPAIAAGCPVVLKPASQTPLSAITLAALLLDECGLPPGWLNVVTGGGGTVGNALVDSDVAMITFTGSPEVGWGIKAPRAAQEGRARARQQRADHPRARRRLARARPTKISVAGFSHAGQSCISTQRVYVHESIAADFVAKLVDRVSTLKVGDPMLDDTDVSALHLARRARPGDGVDRGGGRRRGEASPRAVDVDGTVLAADRAHRRHRRHEGLEPGGVRTGRLGAAVLRPRRRVPAARTTPATGSRPRSTPPTSAWRSRPRGRSTSVACS